MASANFFIRPQAKELERRLVEPRRFIQVVAGPRQVGKTTLVRQVLERVRRASRYASADEPALRGGEWIGEQWEAARLLARNSGRKGAILALDEIQKTPGWSEAVKRLWDEDTVGKAPLRVVLLGSAPLVLQRGLTESLAGRFEIIHMPHWTLLEMRAAFGWDINRFLFFGGYPGAAPLTRNVARWRRYILDSLVETTLARDVFLLSRVDKPALLRRLFDLGCRYSGQILSYQKMLGQLQDAGNTTTLAHYLDLLSAAGMVTGLQKFAGDHARQRGSSPKLQVFSTALLSAHAGLTPAEAKRDSQFWGRLAESAVGAHLLAEASSGAFELTYWRDQNREVDFILRSGRRLVAIEVKSGKRWETLSGMAAFNAAFRPYKTLLVGQDGIALEEFLATPAATWFG